MNMTDVKTLFDYNYWATTRVVRAAERIRRDQFVAPLSGQTASLRDVLMHIMSAERLWRVRWETGSSPDALRAEAFPKLAALRQAPASVLWWRPQNKLPIFFEYTQVIACTSRGSQ